VTDANTARPAGTMLRRAWAAVRLSCSAAPGATAALVGLAVAEGLLPVVGAWSLKLLLDELARGGAATPGRVALATAALAGVGLLLGFQLTVGTYVQATVRRAVRLAVQDRLLQQINAYKDLTPFEDPAFLNRVRLGEQVAEQAPEELFDGVLTALRSALMASGFLTALLLTWPPVVGLLLATAVPSVLLQLRLGRRRAVLTEELTPLARRQLFLYSLLTDTRAAKEIRLFGLGDYLHGRVLGDLRSALASEAALDRRAMRSDSAIQLLAMLVTAIATVVAAYEAMRGRLSVGDVSVFLTATAGVHAAISSAATAVAATYQGLLLFGHYQDLVEDERARSPATPSAAPLPLRKGIEVRDVWFRYGDDQPWVLRGASLSIPCGAAVGLVGLNGAGKSTIVKLICRMYEPLAGTIRWDGVDLREFDHAALRSRITAVFQDFMAYDLTAAENIGVGRLAAIDDLDAIRTAARAAGVDAVVTELPSGYRTLLSRMFESDDAMAASSLLSGGHWQRIALARAFLRPDADLMILDEPSAGLDAQAEHELHRSVYRLRAGRTSLLISHRLNALRDCDIIYVFDGGRVVEHGNHDGLIRAAGLYARLFKLQAAGYQDSPGQGPAGVVHSRLDRVGP
jgi:ATP-binding cassette subfamily B protein